MSNSAHLKPVSGTPAHDRPSPSVRSLPAWAAPAALGAVLALAAVLYGWALGSLGWGNGYYAAARGLPERCVTSVPGHTGPRSNGEPTPGLPQHLGAEGVTPLS